MKTGEPLEDQRSPQLDADLIIEFDLLDMIVQSVMWRTMLLSV